MEAVYEFVGIGLFEHLSIDEVKGKYSITGHTKNPSLRKELQDQPRIEGFLGPMFGGFKEDGQVVVVRYETQKAYDLLSI